MTEARMINFVENYVPERDNPKYGSAVFPGIIIGQK
jgi:hypothetical protein